MEYKRPKIDYPTKLEIEEFHKIHGMKHKLTPEEIKDIKIEFVKFVTKNRKFESKSEVKESLIRYRKLFAIPDDIERMFVNSMITSAKNVPDELIEKKEEKVKETHECPYFCPTCNKRMFNMRSFPRTSYGRNVLSYKKKANGDVFVVYEMKHLSCPNEFQVICLNRVNYELPYELPVSLKTDGKNLGKCPRYGLLLDKEVLSKQ